MNYILCVGDSLTFGARDEYHGSYPAELSRIYWKQRHQSVYCVNHGISGETSGQLLRRIYSNSRSCPQAKIALLLIGTNDTFLPQRQEIYEDNLRQIIHVLKSDHPHVGIGLLPPIIGPGLPNYPRDGQDQADRFNQIILAQAETNALFLADFRGLGEFIIDTVHMNHAGYARMAEIWHDAIAARGLELLKEPMLVNIWATVTHLSDAVFAGARVLTKPGLDLLISEGLRDTTRGRQVWAINPTWLTPGTTGALLRESYTSLRDGTESYLLLVTPGHADLAAGVPPEVVSRQLQELFRRGRAFNKRPITAILGVPPGISPALAQSATALNEVYRASVEPFDGIAVDLRGATFDPWGPTGSHPTDLTQIAPLLVDGILRSHCAATEWTARYGG